MRERLIVRRAQRFDFFLQRLQARQDFFFGLPAGLEALTSSSRSAICRRSFCSRSLAVGAGFLAKRGGFDLHPRQLPRRFVDFGRHRIDFHPQRLAASSTRSIALSGRNRSLM